MDFQIACPHCKQPLVLSDAHRGTQVTCPICHGPFMVAGAPLPVVTLQETPVQSAPPAPASQTPTAPSAAAKQQQSVPSAPRPQSRPQRPVGHLATSSTTRIDSQQKEQESKAKMLLVAMFLGGFGILAALLYFGLQYADKSKADYFSAADISAVNAARENAEKAQRQKELDAYNAEQQKKQQAALQKLKQFVSFNLCEGNDEVAGAMVDELVRVEEELDDAFNNGHMPRNAATFFQQHMLAHMQENTTLRRWIASRSPEKFARAMAILAFGAPQQGGSNGPDTPNSGASLFADGRYTGSGTGFFISPDGWLLTNQHVVGGTQNVDLRLADGAIVSAKVVKTDARADLALLKCNTHPEGWLPVSKGNATMGANVFTIGFPHPALQGIKPKLTTGIISSLSGIQDDDHEYQISVPIQPGNSGGPLVHQQSGWVVGVVYSKLNPAIAGEKTENVNYAIKTSVIGTFLKSNPEALSGTESDSMDPKDVIPRTEAAVVMVLVNKS